MAEHRKYKMEKHIDTFFESLRFSLSHEMRASLRTIIEFINIIQLKHKQNLPDDLTRLMGLITNSAAELNKLTEMMLDYLQITRHSIQKEDVDVNRIILSEIQTLPPERHKNLVFENILPPCHADTTLLTAVFSALISNALKFTQLTPHPRIEIGTQQDNHHITYFVKDNGIGFNMRYIHKLFKPFSRLHQEPEYAGVGLGLAMAHEIMQRHEGRIWVEAIPNEGATFYLQVHS